MPADQAKPDTQVKPPANGAPPVSLIARAKFGFVRWFLWLIMRCFSLSGLYLFGQLFGTCEWLVDYKRRRRFRQHLRRIFGDSPDAIDRRTARRACLGQFVRIRCDKMIYLVFDMIPREKILERIEFSRKADFDEVVAGGKGMYLAMSHVGAQHVGILMMALMRYRLAGVRDPKEGPLRRYIQDRYSRTFPEYRDIRMLYSDSYPRDIYRCFQDGYILGSALDISRRRSEHLRTAKVDLFGQEQDFLVGPIQIALRSKAPIVQGFVLSKKYFKFECVMLGPLTDPDAAEDKPEVVQQVMQSYADGIADFLTHHPDHISKT